MGSGVGHQKDREGGGDRTRARAQEAERSGRGKAPGLAPRFLTSRLTHPKDRCPGGEWEPLINPQPQSPARQPRCPKLTHRRESLPYPSHGCFAFLRSPCVSSSATCLCFLEDSEFLTPDPRRPLQCGQPAVPVTPSPTPLGGRQRPPTSTPAPAIPGLGGGLSQDVPVCFPGGSSNPAPPPSRCPAHLRPHRAPARPWLQQRRTS